MKYTVDESLANFKFWSGAEDRAKNLTYSELEQLDGVIRQAKAERTVSDTLVAAAAIDAVKIIKDANSVIKGGGDVVNQAKQILDTTKAAQSLLKKRSAVSKMLKSATKEYEKTRNIGDPTKEAKDAALADIQPN